MEKELADVLQPLSVASPGSSSPRQASAFQFSPRGQISQPLLDASASAITSFQATIQDINGERPGENINQPEQFAGENGMNSGMQANGTLPGREGVAAKPKMEPVALPKDSRTLDDITLRKEQIDTLFNL